jgi:2-polyprenyl-3-methyl-5-hydroxy-6-metoxy-1,4-benzoquinol methylase
VLFVQRFAELSSGSLLHGYDVVACDSCGFCYADRIPEQAEFDAHYRDMSKYEHQERGGTEPPGDLARLEKVATIIRSAVPARDVRVLDIGCSTGGLLAMLKQAGYTSLRGLDPSPVCAAAARRLHGIDVITSCLNDFVPASERFDLVVLSAVLEHLCEVRSTLAQIRGMLSEQGYIFVSVPNAARFLHDNDAPFQEFSTEHINFFSSVSLSNLLRRAGFQEVFSQENAYATGDGSVVVTPVVDALFQRSSALDPCNVRDEVTQPALEAYIEKSQAIDARIRQIIDQVVEEGQPILVWGTGTHTCRLLATSRLAEAQIAAFVDANPRYQGKHLNNIPILAPRDLVGRSEPILISSRTFQREIVHQIRESLRLNNRLHLLYD